MAQQQPRGTAREVLEAFGRRTGQRIDSDGFHEMAADLVGNLAHLADAHGEGINSIIARGLHHYTEEAADSLAESDSWDCD